MILKYLYDITEDFVRKYVQKEVEGTRLSTADIQFIVDFYSNSMIGNILRWMQRGMQEQQEKLIYKMSISYQATIKALISQIEEEKSKDQTHF